MRPPVGYSRVLVIGGGLAGLAATVDLAARGFDVTLCEAGGTLGGKAAGLDLAGRRLDFGPTVLTLRDVFDQLFEDAGASFEAACRPTRLGILARHVWAGSPSLDLHADPERSAEAIGDFAGAAAARGFRDFMARASAIRRALEATYMRADRPSLLQLMGRAGLAGLPDLWRVSPFTTLWRDLGRHFPDPRLRQLYGRYATYCGASPFEAPATLMLIADVEQSGVWSIPGGVHHLAASLADLARARGAMIRNHAPVTAINARGGRVAGVTLRDGERLDADAVIYNGDLEALRRGDLGPEAARVLPQARPKPSLSAVTWCLLAQVGDARLVRHNVYFSDDYAAEFDAIARGAPPDQPTVYVCAQDRLDDDDAIGWPERLLCLMNAPARIGDRPPDPREFERCQDATFTHLERLGLRVRIDPGAARMTTPWDFARAFPGSGGALYGAAQHGWRAAFSRPGSRTALPGLYLAGGGVHPGPGVPMVALSGRLAAACLAADQASTRRRPAMAMSGGTSTGSATTAATPSP